MNEVKIFISVILSIVLLSSCVQARLAIISDTTSINSIDNNSDVSITDNSFSDEIIEETKYYKILCQEKSCFYYELYDKYKNVIKNECCGFGKPKIELIDDSIIKVTIQTGTEIEPTSTYYYNIKSDKFSRTFTSVFDEFNGMIVYAENSDTIIVRDIFDKQEYYVEFNKFEKEFWETDFPFVSAEFFNNGTQIEVTYLTDEFYRGTTEVFDLNNVCKSDFKIISKVYSDTSHENSDINIRYPQLIGEGKDFSKVNQLISDTIVNYPKLYYGDDYIDLTLDINYRIMKSENDIISIVFEGMGYVETAAHPNNDFFTLNINLDTANIIKLQDIYTIDENFAQIYRECFIQQYPTISVLMDDYTNEELIEMLMEDAGDNYYLTDNSIGISISVGHSLCDHLETEIEYTKLTANKK